METPGAARLAAWGRRFDRVLRIARRAMVVVVAIGIGLWTAPVGAHTALLQASPGPDETAGGTVDFVDLAFLDPVTDAIVTVSFNGEPVAGATAVSDGEIVRFEMDAPLQASGRYQVFYEMTSFDSDYTTSGFFFTYAADAPQTARIDSLEDVVAAADDAGSGFPVLPTLIGLSVLFAVLAVFVWLIDNKRRHELQAEVDANYDR